MTANGDGTLNISMICPFCGKPAVVNEIPLGAFRQWQSGELIQRALPGLTARERETLISGSHESCFDEAFPDE